MSNKNKIYLNFLNDDNLMEYYYECYRCLYRSTNLSDIKKHLERKKKCEKKNENCDIDNKELYEKSIKKIYKNEKIIIKKFEEEKINNINYEEGQCIYCKKKFLSKSNLNTHLKICSIKYIIDNYNIEIKNNNINNKNKIINNTNYINNNDLNKNENENENDTIKNDQIVLRKNNDYNNTINSKENNVFINTNDKDIKKIISFFDDFDYKHIDDNKHIDLVLSNLYIDTFYELMKNEKNHNFLFINNSNLCYIYKNENEKYILLENIFVYTNIIKKIKNFLLIGLEKMFKIKSFYHVDHFKISEYHIKKKYNDYIKGEDILFIEQFKDGINNKWMNFADKCRDNYNYIKNNNLLKNI